MGSNEGVRLPDPRAAAWGRYYDITAHCPKLAHNINNIPFSPAAQESLLILTGVLQWLAGLFPDTHFHLGGDEVVEVRCRT